MMKYSTVPDVYYTFNATECKVSLIDINSTDDSIVTVEGEFAKLFMELVDKANDVSVLDRYSEEERTEIISMFECLVKENLLKKS